MVVKRLVPFAATILFLGKSDAFAPNKNVLHLKKLTSSTRIMGSKDGTGVSGSFFNAVPEGDNGNNADDKDGKKKSLGTPPQSSSSNSDLSDDPFEQGMAELMRRRKAKPRASSPSTLDGVPTSKASGQSMIILDHFM